MMESDGGSSGSGTLESWVREAVASVEVVDVHTHLFPPSHGALMRWGIDELLTYHYLVSEYFMVARLAPGAGFFGLPVAERADLVWQALFVERSPLSEACRGVLTTLQRLGLGEAVAKRDLAAVRAWFAARSGPEAQTAHVEAVFALAKVRYCVMTNIPFAEEEVAQWALPDAKRFARRFKAAVRVDPLLTGDWPLIARCLARDGFESTPAGARAFLAHWAAKTDAVYFMASTPAGFAYDASRASHATKIQRDGSASQSQPQPSLDLDEWDDAEAGPTGAAGASELMDKVLVPAARELGLALALKVGACRGLNPALDACGGGDGVETADLGFVSGLCTRYPDLKMLLTVLARANQHELAVLANKFGQLHVYGCWWYNNVPSIIKETTAMRVELLGTAFTAQHSDARILEQLVYKWEHSRKVIADVLVDKYEDLAATGWRVARAEVQRDVDRLFHGAYEEFLAK